MSYDALNLLMTAFFGYYALIVLCCEVQMYIVPLLSLGNYASQSGTIRAQYPQNQALIDKYCQMSRL